MNDCADFSRPHKSGVPTQILGIDPGLSGALALLNGAALVVVDMPTHAITVNGKVKRQLDLTALGRFLDMHAAAIRFAVIEDVHAMPGQGVSSSFKFGFCAGAIQGIVAANFIATHLVRPANWKKAMGLTADKDASRAMASRLMPAHAHRWPLVKHDGRAEAAMLALYGARHLENAGAGMAA